MDATNTLNQLDGEDQSESELDSYLVGTVRRLRGKAVGDFSVEDLRLMLGQGVGVNHLMPLALAHLERDPLVAGDYYRGDLLGVVLQVGHQYWQSHATEASRLATVVDRARHLIRPRAGRDSTADHLWELIKAHSSSAT